jgi:hypothetical protein
MFCAQNRNDALATKRVEGPSILTKSKQLVLLEWMRGLECVVSEYESWTPREDDGRRLDGLSIFDSTQCLGNFTSSATNNNNKAFDAPWTYHPCDSNLSISVAI